MCALHRRWALPLLAWLLTGCAHLDAERYGIRSVDIEGNDALTEEAISACLISHERPRVTLRLGLSSPRCGQPPFDHSPPSLRLWRWPWTDWPAFNEAVFDQDLERVLRFYRARGYYEAKVVNVKVTPPEAQHPGLVGDCDPARERCEVALLITVEEGAPSLVQSVEVHGAEGLPAELRESAQEALPLATDDPIDETLYTRGKDALRELLRGAGYAAARVEGRVEVDTAAHSARVHYELAPGPLFSLGAIRVVGHTPGTSDVILAATDLRSGDRYDPEAIVEAQREIFAMGAFSSAQIHETLREDNATVDLEVAITPLEPNALRLSVGVMSGAMQRTSTSELRSVPQWDAHLSTRYERRHLFGSLTRLLVEERPRLIFNRDFPRAERPQLGNLVKVGLFSPGLLEARTESFAESAWDYGPEPFLQFVRHDIYMRVGAPRRFFGGVLKLTLAVQQDLFLLDTGPDNASSDGQRPTPYRLSFLEEELILDFRNNPLRPRRGAYLAVHAAQAPRWYGSDWTAFLVSPEARGYVPLFWDLVWASRVLIGGIFITDASGHLDPTSARLGPAPYRLRGGGANSNRGFLAGRLGAGVTGGVRRWEASSELRVPIGGSFELAGFLDLGDVNGGRTFRFDHLNASAGHGFRYYTVLGAIRLDLGYRIARLTRVGGGGLEQGADDMWPFGVPGALHLTIGDAF